jgi:hypothetical protein
MIINRIYEHQNLLSLYLVSFLVGLRNYQRPCISHCVQTGSGATQFCCAVGQERFLPPDFTLYVAEYARYEVLTPMDVGCDAVYSG